MKPLTEEFKKIGVSQRNAIKMMIADGVIDHLSQSSLSEILSGKWGKKSQKVHQIRKWIVKKAAEIDQLAESSKFTPKVKKAKKSTVPTAYLPLFRKMREERKEAKGNGTGKEEKKMDTVQYINFSKILNNLKEGFNLQNEIRQAIEEMEGIPLVFMETLKIHILKFLMHTCKSRQIHIDQITVLVANDMDIDLEIKTPNALSAQIEKTINHLRIKNHIPILINKRHYYIAQNFTDQHEFELSVKMEKEKYKVEWNELSVNDLMQKMNDLNEKWGHDYQELITKIQNYQEA